MHQLSILLSITNKFDNLCIQPNFYQSEDVPNPCILQECSAIPDFSWEEKNFINPTIKIETFVVFDLVRVPVILFLLPLFELGQWIERDFLLALGSLNDGRDELFEERQFEQRRPVRVNEVDDEPLYVRTVLVEKQNNVKLAETDPDHDFLNCVLTRTSSKQIDITWVLTIVNSVSILVDTHKQNKQITIVSSPQATVN